jgi:hypothetical protein
VLLRAFQASHFMEPIMATTPPVATTKNPTQDFKPQFKRVQQTCDHDDAFACIAMLAGKTIEEVKKVAVERFRHPKFGPYWVTADLITALLMNYSWVGTVYKESDGIASLPNLCIGMVDYNPETDIGRHVLFVRQGDANDPKRVETIYDPCYWCAEDKQIRSDIKGLPITWYIGVHPARPEGK